jgi:hypothetical protein
VIDTTSNNSGRKPAATAELAVQGYSVAWFSVAGHEAAPILVFDMHPRLNG